MKRWQSFDITPYTLRENVVSVKWGICNMHCHRFLSALFVDMSSLLTSFISEKYFYFHLFPLVFIYCLIFFKNKKMWLW